MMRVLTMMALTAVTMAAAACGEPAKKAPPPPADANFTFKGSYAKSCRDVTTVENGYLKAECAGVDGFVPTKIQASLCQGDIGNNNGVLVCNGATAVAPNAPNTPAPAPAPAKASPAAKAPAAKDPAAKADKTPPETPAAPKAGAKVKPAA
jgi:hypothetical protein